MAVHFQHDHLFSRGFGEERNMWLNWPRYGDGAALGAGIICHCGDPMDAKRGAAVATVRATKSERHGFFAVARKEVPLELLVLGRSEPENDVSEARHQLDAAASSHR
jgi:hypothetical protein